MSGRQRWTPFLLTLAVVFLDRLTKVIVSQTMRLSESIPFLGDVVRWTYVHNRSMAMSLDFLNAKVLGLLSLPAILILIWLVFAARGQSPLMRWTLAAILGGAVGNTYDRLRFGYVIDFVDVDLPDWLMDRWPVFNIADAAVSVGVVLILLLMIRGETEREQEPARNGSQTAASEPGSEPVESGDPRRKEGP